MSHALFWLALAVLGALVVVVLAFGVSCMAALLNHADEDFR